MEQVKGFKADEFQILKELGVIDTLSEYYDSDAEELEYVSEN